LSLDNQQRHRGSEDKTSDLLIEPEGWAPKEVDMVMPREQRDQGKQKACNERDRTLQVESKKHRSQPEPANNNRTLVPAKRPWNHGSPPL
jgi:hypothetical protein